MPRLKQIIGHAKFLAKHNDAFRGTSSKLHTKKGCSADIGDGCSTVIGRNLGR